MSRRQSKATYHHGDLREACIAAGLELLAESGKDAISFREVARRCHVSPRAPYQHFADKTDFLAALAEKGFEEFGADLRRAKGGLAGLARAYLAFAARRPALMQLMFGSDFEDRASRNPALDRAALATFDELERQIGLVRPRAHARTRRLLAANAWALVHGMAELLRHGQLAHVLGKNDAEAALDVAVTLFAAR